MAVAAIGIAAEGFPYGIAGVRPSIPDLLVGWTLIGCGLAIVETRSRISARLLVASGLAWFAVDFAPLLDGQARTLLEALTLLYLALLAHAVLALPNGRVGRLTSRTAVVAGYVLAFSATAGTFRVGLVVQGAMVALAAIDRSAHAGNPSSARNRAALGAGLVLAFGVLTPAAMRFTSSPPTEPVLAQVVMIAVVLSSALVLVAGSIPDDNAAAIELGDGNQSSLETAVGGLLGRDVETVLFPRADSEGWIDFAGQLADAGRHPLQYVCSGPDVIAGLSVAGPISRDVTAALQELLRLAGEHARLQREVRLRVVELNDSRRRLLEAGDAERPQLERQLRDGALARLDSVASMIASSDHLMSLRSRIAITIGELDGIARGIDPLANRSLRRAIEELATRSTNAVHVSITADEPPSDVARAVWYSCSEAVVNAAKHAAGASVSIDIRSDAGSIIATVVDDGPGGANPSGPGLSGLADRAAALGGSLSVNTSGPGTCVVLTVPTTEKHRTSIPSRSGACAIAEPAGSVTA